MYSVFLFLLYVRGNHLMSVDSKLKFIYYIAVGVSQSILSNNHKKKMKYLVCSEYRKYFPPKSSRKDFVVRRMEASYVQQWGKVIKALFLTKIKKISMMGYKLMAKKISKKM